jgi:outer membrane biosynthesis protein TonB
MTETEIWTKWESQVVNGIFPLRRFLGRSNHSVVFLTECRARSLGSAAIKIIPADTARAEGQLSRWHLAASLSHPHLIRVLESGRCKLGGHPFLFVVTEYAEQNLAQILPHRALTVDEVREMLTPALDALAFLHRQNLVQGQLKAPNFLVVNDQLKLASDTIREAGDAAGIDLAGDMRALGATIVEALTQTRPELQARPEGLSLPATLSPELADAVRRCLSPEPGNRPTVSELRNLIDPAPEATPPAPAAEVAAPQVVAAQVPAAEVTAPQGVASQVPATQQVPLALQVPLPEVSARPASTPPPASTLAPTRAPPPPAVPRRPASMPYPRWLVPLAAVGLVLLLVWGGGRMLRPHDSARPVAAPIASQQSFAPAPAPSPAPVQRAGSPVLHEEFPAISHSTRESIHGQIKVAVSVTVDRAGNVVAENLEVHGSSKYFARLASDAARKWKFVPADSQSAREWLVQFEFSRSGVTGQAVPQVKQ